jgi:hypothetical protein
MWTQALVVSAVVLPAILAGILWLWVRFYRRRHPNLERARKTFHFRREWLEARFFTLAAQSGRPRDLEWVDCEFEDGVSFARDRQSGQLRALVGVTIRFRAVAGGVLEHNPNVANLRAATAVFTLVDDEWRTDGRALFNLNPVQAIQRLHEEMERVE